jgi:hypothetical protein
VSELNQIGREKLDPAWYRKASYSLKANQENLTAVERKIEKIKSGSAEETLKAIRTHLGSSEFNRLIKDATGKNNE